MSPFDYAASITKTKQYAIDSEEIFSKEYNPFMVNRILANDTTTILFADILNEYYFLDKKLQYDFLFHGIPKNNKYVRYIKKDGTDVDDELIKFVQQELNVSLKRALDIIMMLGDENIKNVLEQRGGKWSKNKKNPMVSK